MPYVALWVDDDIPLEWSDRESDDCRRIVVDFSIPQYDCLSAISRISGLTLSEVLEKIICSYLSRDFVNEKE